MLGNTKTSKARYYLNNKIVAKVPLNEPAHEIFPSLFCALTTLNIDSEGELKIPVATSYQAFLDLLDRSPKKVILQKQISLDWHESSRFFLNGNKYNEGETGILHITRTKDCWYRCSQLNDRYKETKFLLVKEECWVFLILSLFYFNL